MNSPAPLGMYTPPLLPQIAMAAVGADVGPMVTRLAAMILDEGSPSTRKYGVRVGGWRGEATGALWLGAHLVAARMRATHAAAAPSMHQPAADCPARPRQRTMQHG